MTEIDETRRLLEQTLGANLLTRQSPEFETAAALIFAGDDEPPALVARPRDTDEVSAVVRAAAATGIPFAVRGGGHSYARQSTVAHGLILDLRLLGGATVDRERRVGTAFGGTTAGQYTTVAAEHGLATGFGDTGTVGVPGLALGGGIGFLSRRDGLTIDNVLSAEVVLADGGVVTASAAENPELFWALRGGGGNFGVVTRLDLRLSEAATVTAGLLAFEPDAHTLTALVDAAAEAPDELSLMINAMKTPPMPFLPAERHGKPMVLAMVCHSGDAEQADTVLAPFRAAGTVIVDLVRRQPYPDLFAAGPAGPAMRAAQRTGFLDVIDEESAAAAIEAMGSVPTMLGALNLRPMGGAIARVGRDATAFAHRDRRIMATIGTIDPDPARMRAGGEWADALAYRLGVQGAAYVNFLGQPRTQAAEPYPSDTLRRLRDVKREFDPGNLFRSNHNIVPAEPEPARV